MKRLLRAAVVLAALCAGPASALSLHLSKDGGFALSLPPGSEPRSLRGLSLDIIGWQRTGDHSSGGAIWKLNRRVFERFGGEAGKAADVLREKHRCGERACATTPTRRRPVGRDGELAYYELRDPSVPSDRGVLAGVLRLGSEFYRVQAINYAPAERAALLDALESARAARPGLEAFPSPEPDFENSSPDWGLSFSGESDASFEQDSRSEREAPPPPPPPAPSEPKAPPPAPVKRAPPKPPVAAAKRAPETLPAIPLPPVRGPVPEGEADYEELDESKLHDPIPDLIELLRSKRPRMRARAADALGQRGEPAAAAVPALTAALGDPDGRVRASAALALGNIGPAARGAVPKLRALAKDRSADARASAETALKALEK